MMGRPDHSSHHYLQLPVPAFHAFELRLQLSFALAAALRSPPDRALLTALLLVTELKVCSWTLRKLT